MLLAYIDDAGTSYEKVNGFFKDGPYSLWVSVLIPENKYFHTERMYYDLMSRLLKVKDWREIELHATDVWNRAGYFSKLSEKQVRLYFEELFQLISKLKLQVVVGICQKNPRLTSSSQKRKQIGIGIYSFFHGLEHALSSLNETAVLIADKTNLHASGGGFTDLELELFNRTKWRYNPGSRKSAKFLSKYYFESLSCFMLDQLHHSESKNSFLVQFADQIAFVIQRVFTYSFLVNFPGQGRPTADSNKVPVTPQTFNFFTKATEMSIAHYDPTAEDIFFFDSKHQEIGRLNQYVLNDLLKAWTPMR